MKRSQCALSNESYLIEIWSIQTEIHPKTVSQPRGHNYLNHFSWYTNICDSPGQCNQYLETDVECCVSFSSSMDWYYHSWVCLYGAYTNGDVLCSIWQCRLACWVQFKVQQTLKDEEELTFYDCSQFCHWDHKRANFHDWEWPFCGSFLKQTLDGCNLCVFCDFRFNGKFKVWTFLKSSKSHRQPSKVSIKGQSRMCLM